MTVLQNKSNYNSLKAEMSFSESPPYVICNNKWQRILLLEHNPLKLLCDKSTIEFFFWNFYSIIAVILMQVYSK